MSCQFVFIRKYWLVHLATTCTLVSQHIFWPWTNTRVNWSTLNVNTGGVVSSLVRWATPKSGLKSRKLTDGVIAVSTYLVWMSLLHDTYCATKHYTHTHPPIHILIKFQVPNFGVIGQCVTDHTTPPLIPSYGGSRSLGLTFGSGCYITDETIMS